MDYLHRQRRLVSTGISSLIAVFCALLLVMPALAATVANVTIPISGTVLNPCNGEAVAFSGTDHFTARVTLDNGGGFHLGLHDNIHVTAIGDQGNTYVGNQEDNFVFNGKVGEEETNQLTFSEISNGSAPNFIVHALFHITVNANGNVTAFVDNFTAECRG